MKNIFSLSPKLKKFFDLAPGEEKLVGLNFLQSFLIGLPRLFTVTAASALFLENNSADNIPYVFLISAVLISIIGFIYLRLEKVVAFVKIQTSTMLLLSVASCVFISLLWLLPNEGWPTFALWVWFDVEWILTNIVFWGVANRLFTVRQGKRLFGLIGAGEIVAMIMGGFLTPYLVQWIGTRNLLFFSLLGFLIGFVNLLNISRSFGLEVRSSLGSPSTATPERRGSFLSLFRVRYVVLIFLFYAFMRHIVDYYLNNIFFYEGNAQYPDSAQFASFMGQFLAVFGFLSLSFRTVSGRWMLTFGQRISILTTPIIVMIGSGFIAFSGLLAVESQMIFWAAVSLKLTKDLFAGAIAFPTYYTLYQPLPMERRTLIQTSSETIVGPVLGMFAGAILLLLVKYFHLASAGVSIMLLLIALGWIIISILTDREYREALLVATRINNLNGRTFTREDRTLRILERRLTTPYPHEVIYCLHLLEQLQPLHIKELLLPLINHPDAIVRAVVYRSIEKLSPNEQLALEACFEPLKEQLMVEQNPQAKVALLRALGATGTADAFELISPALDDPNPEMQRGAMVALILHCGIQGAVLAGHFLMDIESSELPEERKLAALTLGQIGLPTLYRSLVPFLTDEPVEVRKAALIAASQVNNPRLWPFMIENLSDDMTRETAVQSLIKAGEPILPSLESAYEIQLLPVRRQIIRIYGRIKGELAISLLLKKLAEEDRSLLSEILLALCHCEYQSTTDKDKALINRLIKTEVSYGLRVSVALKELEVREAFHLLFAALNDELEKVRSRLFHLLSFIYTSELIMKIWNNYKVNQIEKKDLAVELFDNTIYNEHKVLVQPVLFPRDSPVPELQAVERIKEIITEVEVWSNAWLRACAIDAADAAIRLSIQELHKNLSPLLNDPDPLVRETVNHAPLIQLPHLEEEQRTALTTFPIIEKVKILRTTAIFADLPYELLAEISPHFVDVKVEAEETIVTSDQLAGHLFIVADGALKISTGVELSNHQSFGELEALKPAPWLFSVVALKKTHLLRLSHDYLTLFVASRPELAKNILRFLYNRLQVENQIPLLEGELRNVDKETANVEAPQEPVPNSPNIPDKIGQNSLSLLEKLIVLRNLTILADTSEEVLADIADLSQEIVLKPGEVLFKEGDIGNYLYLIIQGNLHLQRAHQHLGDLGSRTAIGVLVTPMTEAWGISALATENTRLLSLNHPAIMELMWERHEIILHLIQVLVNGLRRQ